MAVSQSKRSAHRAQPAHRFVNTVNALTTKRAGSIPSSLGHLKKSFHFQKVKGKVVEDVEFTSSPDYHAISLSFRDKTCLDLVIDTWFSVHADYLDRKTGDRRVLKKWPLLHAVPFRGR